jgi:predicted ester cyclase
MDASSESANKDLVKRYFGAMERGDIEEALGYWAAGAVNYASGRVAAQEGRERLGAVFQMLRTAFPDGHFQIDDLIAEGDKVVCRMTVSGVFGAPPSLSGADLPPNSIGVEGTRFVRPDAVGKSYSVKHVHVFRIDEGLIAEHWAARDDLGLLLQLGAIAPPPIPVED